jgi:galactokinase/galacturonokinase
LSGFDLPLSDLIEEQCDKLHTSGAAKEDIRVVVSPYRICPIGAHSDHQLGPTLGMGVSAYTLLAFAPATSSEVNIYSENYPEEQRFDLSEPLEKGRPDWGCYARGAVFAIQERLPSCPKGLSGRVYGTLPGGGLSSSASVILAYLLALADVNDVKLEPEELVSYALRAETDFVGVSVGILDPAAIVGSRREHLLAIDTRTSQWKPLRLGRAAPDYRILVVFTGTTRNLSGTGYNQRVAECLSAAKKLGELSGLKDTRFLGDFDESVFQHFREKLPTAEKRRASHFFGERARVLEGMKCWQRGDLEAFGRLMKKSCDSSIHNYETGSEELIELQRILVETPGVFGSRFSGAGFAGCCIALVSEEEAEPTRTHVEKTFLARFPHTAGRARAFLIESEDGARVV